MKRIGIIGGGQLGLMIAQAAKALGAYTVALDPAQDAPAFAVTDGKIVAAYDDPAALEQLCEQVDVVTYEFENIPAQVLVPLGERYNIKQGYRPLLDSQDRLIEKRNAQDRGLTTPAFEAVDDEESLRAAIESLGLPSVLKTRRLGYDGHGQCVIRTQEDIAEALPLLTVPCILEAFVDFDYECSVVAVRSAEDAVVFPVGQNIHRSGILDLCIVPAPMPSHVRHRVEQQTLSFMEQCGYEGILAIEYFVRGEEVIFNEMAPRPHNSGHYTIEGSTNSQFRALVEYLLDMPLTPAELVAPTIMKNILGEDLVQAEKIAQEAHPDTYVHIYGKTVSKPKRKMGHITFVGMTLEEYNTAWRDRFVK